MGISIFVIIGFWGESVEGSRSGHFGFDPDDMLGDTGFKGFGSGAREGFLLLESGGWGGPNPVMWFVYNISYWGF